MNFRSIFGALTAAILTIGVAIPASADHHGSKKANIVETAQEAGSFGTLLAAAQAAGLAGTLAEGGPFTVFAPTDDAFAALGEDTINDLLKPENKETLKSILLYHVVEGKVPASAVLGKSQSVATLNGQEIAVDGTGGGVEINGSATVTAPDVMASNGVIHVIDTVLLPESN